MRDFLEHIKKELVTSNNKFKFQKLFVFFLFISNLFYLSYILIIAYHNVIIYDDYWFMAQYKKFGLFGSLSWWYQYWQGRFISQLLINLVVKGYEFIPTLLPYTMLLISIFIYSIIRLFKYCLCKILTESCSYHPFLIINFALFLFNFFLIINFEFSTFYWITVSVMYFGGLAAALLATGELISDSKNIFSYLVVGLGFAFAGCSAEHFGAICTILLTIYLFWILSQQKFIIESALKNPIVIKCCTAFLFCSISFLVMILSPGNEIRRNLYEVRISIFDASLTGLKSLFFILTLVITEKVKYFIIVSFPFTYLGTLFRKKESIDDFKAALIIAGSLPIFVFFLYICMLPTAYALSSIGPHRALTHIAFYVVAYVAFLSFIIGYKTPFPKKLAFLFSMICLLFYLNITLDRFRINLNDTIKYTKSERDRIKKLMILKAEGNEVPTSLDRLYTSPRNVLFYIELEEDSVVILKQTDKYYLNKYITDGLELGFEVKVKKCK